MPKVLLVDTNFSAGPILAHLQALGHEVLVCGGKPSDHLAKHHPNYIQLNYADSTALQAFCQQEQIQHIIPGCNDVSYNSCAHLAANTASPCIDPIETIEHLHNKQAFRTFAKQQGLSTPTVFNPEGPTPHTSIIVKPVDAFSGRGVTLLQHPTPKTLQQALHTAQQHSRCGNCLVEQYIEGQLYSHSAFLTNQRIAQDFWVIEHSSANPFVVDTSHMAVDIPASATQRVRQEIEHIAHTLGLKNGLIHTQFILKDNDFYLIEITRRCPGDLYSQLIELSTGFPYAANYARAFLGLPLLTPKPLQHPILRHTLSLPTASLLGHIQFHHPLHIERWVPLATTGDALEPSPASRIALLFARCQSHQALETLAAHAVNRQLYSVHR